MTNKVEITPQERARLSKETMLKWYNNQRKAKLKALRKEILKAHNSGKIDALKTIIISNTKADLKKHKKLTDAESLKRATEFANKLITLAIANKSFDQLAQSYATKKKGSKGDQLLDQWMKNNPDGLKAVQPSPRYLVLKEITNRKDRTEFFMLLGMVEKLWSKNEALALYNSCWNKSRTIYSFDKLREFFSRENTLGRTGFYYGTRIIRWDPVQSAYSATISLKEHSDSIKFDYEMETNWYGRFQQYKINVKGWWAHDTEGDTNKSNYVDDKGKNFEKDVLPLLRKQNKKGYGDEWLGRDFRTASKYVKDELRGTKKPIKRTDSGINDPEKEQKVLDALKKLTEEESEMYPSSIQRKIPAWFKKGGDKENKWVRPDEKLVGYMVVLWGRGWGNNLFRYAPDENRIYFLRLDKINIPQHNAKFGFIKLKEGRAIEWKYFPKMKDVKSKMKIEILDKIKDKNDVDEELATQKVKSSAGTYEEKLKATKGLAYLAVKKIKNKVFEHNKIKDNFINPLEKELVKKLKGKYKDKIARELAKIRAEHVEKTIRGQIEDNAALKQAVEENEREKLRIEINSADEVKVEIKDKKIARKWKNWAKQKAEGVKTTVGDLVEGTMARLESKIEKWLKPLGFGFLAPAVVWAIDWVFKIGDAFKKMAKGGTSLIGGLFTSIFGVKLLKDKLRSKKITEEVIEKLPPKKKKFYKFSKKMYFAEDVKLKNKKIVIPSGKGINPGKEFDVNVKGVRDAVTVKPVEEKKGLLGGIFGRRNKEKYRLKDSEITLTKGTTIPKGTVIPKGAKIYKA